MLTEQVAALDDDEAVDEVLTDERDVEEDEHNLDEQYDDDPLENWERRQRDLVSSVLDYNLSSLTGLVRTNQIDLSPAYQRRNRWRDDRKSQLIESFLMNVPVPPIFLNEDEYGRYSVIDGKQRLTAIFEFLQGRLKLKGLKVFHELNGLYFDSLPQTLKTILETRANIRAVIILRQSDPEIKFEVFRRLNTGGIRLNPQEIRNSAYPGRLNDMILEEASSPRFHALLGIRDRSRSSLYREMRDAEFVLRFLTFHEDWDVFQGGMGRKLDRYMSDNHAVGESEVERLRENFQRATARVEAAFGDLAFKRWQPERNAWRHQVLASMYDAQIFGLQTFRTEELRNKREELTAGMKALFDDADFRKAVDSATNTPSYFKDRIRMTREMGAEILGG